MRKILTIKRRSEAQNGFHKPLTTAAEWEKYRHDESAYYKVSLDYDDSPAYNRHDDFDYSDCDEGSTSFDLSEDIDWMPAPKFGSHERIGLGKNLGIIFGPFLEGVAPNGKFCRRNQRFMQKAWRQHIGKPLKTPKPKKRTLERLRKQRAAAKVVMYV